MNAPNSAADPKSTAEQLMGVLLEQQRELLKAARFLAVHTSGKVDAYVTEQLIPKLCQRIHALQGDRPLTPECEADELKEEDRETVRQGTGLGNELTAECLHACLTTRLVDLCGDLSRCFFNYHMLHSLALIVDDEVLAGMAWSHANEIKEMLAQGSLLLPSAAAADFGGDASHIAEAMEQVSRLW